MKDWSPRTKKFDGKTYKRVSIPHHTIGNAKKIAKYFKNHFYKYARIYKYKGRWFVYAREKY